MSTDQRYFSAGQFYWNMINKVSVNEVKETPPDCTASWQHEKDRSLAGKTSTIETRTCHQFVLLYLPINCPSSSICPSIAINNSFLVMAGLESISLSRAYILK